MSLFKVFDLSGSALSSQSIRMNAIASNVANAEVASANPEGAYRARYPVFQTVLEQAGKPAGAGVRVAGIIESTDPPVLRNMPGHPLADENGNVYFPAVNVIEQMTDWMSAESTYRTNVELMSTVKQLMLRTLQIGSR